EKSERRRRTLLALSGHKRIHDSAKVEKMDLVIFAFFAFIGFGRTGGCEFPSRENRSIARRDRGAGKVSLDPGGRYHRAEPETSSQPARNFARARIPSAASRINAA